jgi:hypothetical protein
VEYEQAMIAKGQAVAAAAGAGTYGSNAAKTKPAPSAVKFTDGEFPQTAPRRCEHALRSGGENCEASR